MWKSVKFWLINRVSPHRRQKSWHQSFLGTDTTFTGEETGARRNKWNAQSHRANEGRSTDSNTGLCSAAASCPSPQIPLSHQEVTHTTGRKQKRAETYINSPEQTCLLNLGIYKLNPLCPSWPVPHTCHYLWFRSISSLILSFCSSIRLLFSRISCFNLSFS